MSAFPPAALQPVLQEVTGLLKERKETVAVAETVSTTTTTNTTTLVKHPY